MAVATTALEAMGGAERVVLKIAGHFDATVFTTRYSPEVTFEGFRDLDVKVLSNPLQRLPIGKRLSTGLAAGTTFYYTDLCKFGDFDLVNAHQSPSEWLRNKNKPMIFYCHSPNREAFDLYEWRMRRRDPLRKLAFWSAIKAFRHFEFQIVPKIEYIFTNSKNSKGRIKKYLNRDAEILHPGIDVEKFRSGEYGNYFLYPSRITPEKDIEFSISAFRRLCERVKSHRLVIAGALSDRPEHVAYFEKLKKLAAGLPIEFRTNVGDDEYMELYSGSLAVLYTPINEDFGLVPLEAMAAEKPCIAKNEGGPRETVIDGVDGFLVNTSEEMADRMEFFIRNPAPAGQFGKKGRKKVERDFTWENFLKRFKEKAKEVIKNAEEK